VNELKLTVAVITINSMKILKKCLIATLIAGAVATFLNVAFVKSNLNLEQLSKSALILFILILCYELIMDWLKTRRSGGNK